MKKKHQHIQQVLAVVMLWVFALAITPWSALHQHEEAAHVAAERHCTHKVHLKAQQDTCLICVVHFEKNYTRSNYSFATYLASQRVINLYSALRGSYTALIATSLRGPPAFSA